MLTDLEKIDVELKKLYAQREKKREKWCEENLYWKTFGVPESGFYYFVTNQYAKGQVQCAVLCDWSHSITLESIPMNHDCFNHPMDKEVWANKAETMCDYFIQLPKKEK